LFDKTGKKVGGQINWTKISPKEMQSLSERMFDAANVPQSARQEYYRAFNQYNYRE
jgi:toxin YokI